MTREDFGALAAAYGWKCTGAAAYGVHKGYPFAAHVKPGKVGTVTVVFSVNRGVPLRAQRALKKQLPKGCSMMQPLQGQVNLICAGREELVQENLRAAMDAVAQMLREAMLVPPETCPYCKQKDCDAVMAVGVGYLPVHRACAERKAGGLTADAEVNAATGSYLMGFLGAFLGGLVGVLPTILAVLLTQRIYGLLYALIPICAYEGYRICKGKMNKAAFWITCAVSLFHLFSIEQIYFYASIVQELHIWPSILDSIQYYWYVMEPSDIFADLGQSLLFLAIGIWIAWGKITRTSRSEAADIGAALDTLAGYAPRHTAEL